MKNPKSLLVLATTLVLGVPSIAEAVPPYLWAGGANSCAVVNGAALCWGANTEGQVGNGTTTMAKTPAQVVGLTSGVQAIVTGGSHSCAIVNGGAQCWGNNAYGQLGNNGAAPSSVPVQVSGLSSGVTAIGVGELHTCAVHNGAAKCWGSGGYGQLGTGGSIFSSAVPVAVAGLGSGVTDVNAGRYHTCAVLADGSARCWGRGDSGEMGNGTNTYINQGPVAVTGATSGVGLVSAGDSYSCGIQAGAAYCWGFGSPGVLGNGGTANVNLASPVTGLGSGVGLISAGNGLHACAIASGPVCWGRNNAGQLGNAAAGGGTTVPIAVQGLPSGVVDLVAGGLHTCAATETAIYCWGDNTHGQLGIGNQNPSGSPVLVMNVPPPSTPTSRLVNISTRMQVLTGDDVMIGGFIIGGSANKTVVVRARGPSLADFGIAGALANPQLQLFSGPTVIAANDNWGSAANAAAIQSSGFAPANSQEAAIMMTLAPGAYTAIVSGVGNTTGVSIVEVFEVDAPTVPLINIATRGRVQTGDNVMIAGIIVQGDGPKTLVVRARGPSLAAAGIASPLANPTLQLFSGPTPIATNDNWQQASNAADVLASGFAPSNTLESAILITLQPGAYTAIVSGVSGTSGVAIVEVFTQ